MSSKHALDIIKKYAGDEAFRRISEELKGETVYFPSDYQWGDKAFRNDALREDFFSGEYEISDLALKYKLSISSVYKIVQRRD